MASLNPYNSVLGVRKAKHLLRRASFVYNKSSINTLAAMTAVQAVQFLSTNPDYTLEKPYDPQYHGYWTESADSPNSIGGQAKKRTYLTAWWWYNAANSLTLKYKMSFFLHTCFSIAKSEITASTYYYDYMRLLDFHALGNVKTLAKKITLDNAMLIYLDNRFNNAYNINENYAREYLELFTILKGPQIADGNYTNYTEEDVVQAALVFTGFKNQYDRTVLDPDTNIPKGSLVLSKHNPNDKVFSEAFNNQVIVGQNTEEGAYQELDEFVSMIFNQEATAISYCKKLYRYFVKSEWTEEVENDIIIPLAQQLIAENFELLPIVQTLLSSQHFYDEDDTDNTNEILGSIIKNPLQLYSEIYSMLGVQLQDPTDTEGIGAIKYYLNYFNYFIHNSYFPAAGMPLFDPDTVAGYPAFYQSPDFDRHWFSSNTLIARYKIIQCFITQDNTFANNNNIWASLNLIEFVENNINNPSNPTSLITEIASLLYVEDISESRIAYFVAVLLDEYNDYYWTNAWNQYQENGGNETIIKNRLNELFTTMINAAEFQLM